MNNICIKCDNPKIVEEIAVRRGVPYKRNVCKNCGSVHMTEAQMTELIKKTKLSKNQELTYDT